MQPRLFVLRGFFVFGDLFQPRFLRVGFGDVTGDERFGFGRFAQGFDVFAETLLVFGNFFNFRVELFQPRRYCRRAGFQVNDFLQRGAGGFVYVAAGDEEI